MTVVYTVLNISLIDSKSDPFVINYFDAKARIGKNYSTINKLYLTYWIYIFSIFSHIQFKAFYDTRKHKQSCIKLGLILRIIYFTYNLITIIPTFRKIIWWNLFNYCHINLSFISKNYLILFSYKEIINASNKLLLTYTLSYSKNTLLFQCF